MKLERISALVQVRGLQGHTDPRRPGQGESLLLTYDGTAGEDQIVTLSNGMTLRLAGLGRWQRELRPGDALRVRVLSSDPVLELEVESGPIRSGAGGEPGDDEGPSALIRHAAMRVDQAALRQMTWLAPNPAALARSWHDLALERWGSGAAMRPPDGETHLTTTMLGPPPFREPAGTPRATVLDRWLMPVYAWGGVQMMLGLIYSEPRERKGRRRRPRGPLLRLELAPPALGSVVLLVHWLAGGIELMISIEQPHAAGLVREALPKLAQTLLQAGLALADLRLMQGDALIAQVDLAKLRPHEPRLAPPRSSLPLFRALAETAVVLLQIVPRLPR